MRTYIVMLEVPKLSQHKRILLPQYVQSFFSTDISDQIIWHRRPTGTIIKMAFMNMVLTFPRPTLLKLFPVYSRTQPHLLTCHRRTV